MDFGQELSITKQLTKECAEEAKKRLDELIENAFKYAEFEVNINEGYKIPKEILTASIMTLAQEYTEMMDKEMENNVEIIFETM